MSALTEIDYVGRISNEAELSLFIISNIVFFFQIQLFKSSLIILVQLNSLKVTEIYCNFPGIENKPNTTL